MFEPALAPGTLITGKWNKRQYRIERLLGQGANGTVYLISRGKQIYAMKVGRDARDLQSEINVLHKLEEKKKEKAVPFLIDVDDASIMKEELPYYVMKYVGGSSLSDYLHKKGQAWLPLIGTSILRKLTDLHAQGWIFGDLKIDNLIVCSYGEVELVDYGGATAFGRSVRQFTEIYDRGYWGAGSRKADEGYDLFSFAVLVIILTDPQHRIALAGQLPPQNRNVDYVLKIAETCLYTALQPFVQKAILGQFRSSGEALKEWKRGTFQPEARHAISFPSMWIKGFFIASLVMFVSSLCIVMQ